MTGGANRATPFATANPENDARARLMTADELAARWQVPKAHVYRLSRSGQLPTVRLGKYYRYSLQQIEAFEAGPCTAADAVSDGSPGPERIAA